MKQVVIDSIGAHSVLVKWFESRCVDTVLAAAEMIADCIDRGGCIYICGNGGSAADAQHISGELIGRFMKDRRAFAAVALTTDSSVITSVANDYSFEDIFARQVQGLVRKGDLLWALSTSGESGNVISAAKLAKEKGAAVLAFTGRAGAKLEGIADLCLAIESPTTARAQEVHQLAYHIICDLVERRLCPKE
jgi:D-sedoheptulose 7-phosphate isomerase